MIQKWKLLSKECAIDFSRHIIVKLKKIRGKRNTKIGHAQGPGNANVVGLLNSNTETRIDQGLQNSE